MATIFIRDTGAIKVGNESGTLLTGADIVNAGTEVPLKVVRVSFERGNKFDNTPRPGSFTETELNVASITTPLINITGVIKKTGDLSSERNTIYQITEGETASVTLATGSSSTDEIEMLGLLNRLAKTKGYKELYFKSTVADNLLYGIAETDSHDTDIAATYRHLHVRVRGLNITELPLSSLIRWKLTCEMTA